MRTMDAYAIRPGRADELGRILDIEREAAALFAPYGLDGVFATLLTPLDALEEGVREGRLWVATDLADRPVGFALATVVGENAHLDELDVHPDHGRRGLGRALVETFLAWAREHAYPGASLTTLRHVPWNAPLYESLGFRILGPEELPDALRTLLDAEIRRGLPGEGRVAMFRRLPSD